MGLSQHIRLRSWSKAMHCYRELRAVWDITLDMLFGPDRNCTWYWVMKWACAKNHDLGLSEPSYKARQATNNSLQNGSCHLGLNMSRWHKQPAQIGSLDPTCAHPLLHKCLFSSCLRLCGVSIITNWQNRGKPSLIHRCVFWVRVCKLKWTEAALEPDQGKRVVRKNLR